VCASALFLSDEAGLEALLGPLRMLVVDIGLETVSSCSPCSMGVEVFVDIV
jgi:hypothetical protein